MQSSNCGLQPGSGAIVAQLAPYPIVEQALLVTQRVGVAGQAAVEQITGIGQLALALVDDLAVGIGEGELQLDPWRIDVAHDAHIVQTRPVPRLVIAGALDVGDGHLQLLSFRQLLAGLLAQVFGQGFHPVAALCIPAVAAVAQLGELGWIGPLHLHRAFHAQCARGFRGGDRARLGVGASNGQQGGQGKSGDGQGFHDVLLGTSMTKVCGR